MSLLVQLSHSYAHTPSLTCSRTHCHVLTHPLSHVIQVLLVVYQYASLRIHTSLLICICLFWYQYVNFDVHFHPPTYSYSPSLLLPHTLVSTRFCTYQCVSFGINTSSMTYTRTHSFIPTRQASFSHTHSYQHVSLRLFWRTLAPTHAIVWIFLFWYKYVDSDLLPHPPTYSYSPRLILTHTLV